MATSYMNERGRPKHVLGNYIYLNWENYKRAGTRNIWSRTTPSEPVISNFNEKIFIAHRSNILNAVRSFKISNLQALEKEYNDSLKMRNDEMKRLAKEDPGKFQSILEVIISSLGQSYAARAAELAQFVTWDAVHDRPLVADKISSLNLDNIPMPPAITFGVTAKRGQCAPRIKFCDEMLKYIRSINDNKDNDDSLILNRIKTGLTNISKSYRRNKNIISPDAIAYELTYNQALGVDAKLKLIRAGYIDVKILNTALSAAWSEFSGNVLEYSLESLVYEQLMEALNVGKQTTSAIAERQNVVGIKINTEAAKSYVEQRYRQANSILEGPLAKKEIAAIGKQTKMIMNFENLGSDVANKRDIAVTLSGKKYGISMKNTNLLAPIDLDAELKEHQIPHVSLQNSSLALYLMGIEAEQEALGTHYLNVFATHEDQNIIESSLRKQANQSLSLYILYSALTGEGQLRSQAKVNIFAIYDKASRNNSRVKFFDIADLILKCAQDQQAESALMDHFLIPNISTITLNNAKEFDTSDSSGVAKRIAKVLAEAKLLNIQARLTNSFLQNVYKNRK